MPKRPRGGGQTKYSPKAKKRATRQLRKGNKKNATRDAKVNAQKRAKAKAKYAKRKK
jgi:hypothetical protein